MILPGQTRQQALRHAVAILSEAGIDGAASDARFLLLHALGITQTDLVLYGNRVLNEEGAARFGEAVRRRLDGEPVARILGEWEFWGLPFVLNAATLVPRPDTETVVEAALALHPDRHRPLRLLDLGTGSGCILVSLLSEWGQAFGVGLDRSHEALACARTNARINGVGRRAAFLVGDWCSPFGKPFDVIVSNPPYIPSATIPTLADEVRLHDPHAALDGGEDGLLAYRWIVAEATGRVNGEHGRPALLGPDGALVLEVGYDQAEAVRRIGIDAGFSQASIRQDLAGHARVVTLSGPLSAGNGAES
ncbi:peptide chain release factor N(5)-glutamine methyltransferase [Methylobacterium marchantiae]|uniref:Release factor glutamine methyltransferase n=1 Tax=Methylobacterium marchantiae TaxID=600331 RepID=A0ABW3X2B5_9HYPH|nr:Release factor glutamine methyltransferase [Methylobacterium marchantiae]